MRDTFAFIDGATEKNEDLRHALYDLAAQQLAGQALSIAFATLGQMDQKAARHLIEKVAGYPGITMRRMRDGSEMTVGDRACEILVSLAKMRQNFFV